MAASVPAASVKRQSKKPARPPIWPEDRFWPTAAGAEACQRPMTHREKLALARAMLTRGVKVGIVAQATQLHRMDIVRLKVAMAWKEVRHAS